jgi:hypothetical protein
MPKIVKGLRWHWKSFKDAKSILRNSSSMALNGFRQQIYIHNFRRGLHSCLFPAPKNEPVKYDWFWGKRQSPLVKLSMFFIKFHESSNWGGIHKAIYALRLKSMLYAHPICTNLPSYGMMHMRPALNLLQFSTRFGCAQLL